MNGANGNEPSRAGEEESAHCGVSTSHHGEPFVYEDVFDRADAALCEDKKRGMGTTSVPGIQTEVFGGSER